MTIHTAPSTLMLDSALDYAARGWCVFPAPPGMKKSHKKAEHSGGRRWGNTCDPAEIVRDFTRWPNANVGIACGPDSGVFVIEADTLEGHDVDGIGNLRALIDKHGPLPDTVEALSPSGSWHLYFAWPDGAEISNSASIIAPGVDVRGDGGMAIAAPSVKPGHDEPYRWINPPGLFDPAPCPDWLLALAIGASKINRAADKVRKAAPGTRNDALNRTAFALGQDGELDRSAVAAALAKAGLSAGLDPDEIGATIASGFGAGQRNPKRKEPSEDDVALAFTALHRDRLRFDHDQGCWYEWNGTRWQRDNHHRAFTYAREIGRQMGGAGKANFAGGVERFARADRAHAVTAETWDSDLMMLGTPAGIVDLRTGSIRACVPGDHMTKLTGCAPALGRPQRWLQFLEESLAGDSEAIRFVQQWFGYCLTGDTREHALAFIYGPGGNGKSVLLNTLIAILGDYAVTATMETFTASKHDRHSTELAMLRGARLVTASETEEGRHWAEARIKAMTGGDPITARFMRCDNFTFQPQFKLMIAGNHAPQLANVDDAMRRRFNIVPFVNKPAAPDRELENKLRAEHGQILAWAIEGCTDWLASGLVRPSTVTEATASYFEEQDLFGQWLAERCVIGAGKWELSTPLFNSWHDFAREAGEDAGSSKGFSGRLAKRGLRHGRATGGYRKYDGLALRTIRSDGSDA